MTYEMEFHQLFGKELDPEIGCIRIADTAAPGARRLSNQVIDVMKQNYNNMPNLKWQYFGSEEGIFSIYPASIVDDCFNYDHRYRPWYVEAATPEPKNVVIVIDTSASMEEETNGKTLMQIAIDAAITVLDTMNPSDKVGVVSFSDTVFVPGGFEDTDCYKQELAKATLVNIENLKEFVSNLRSIGGTKYGIAFTTAFDLLRSSWLEEEHKREQVILFLTDGEPNDDPSDIMSVIRSKNEEMMNRVVILTFGLGNDGGLDFLEDISSQKFEDHGLPKYNESVGEVKLGHYTHVTDYTLLRSKMARYYDYFAFYDSLQDEPIFSVPYQDGFGLGLMTTAALPVKYNRKLMGVVGVDITLDDLLADVTFFKKGASSYAFIFEANSKAAGRALIHPLLPAPMDIADEPIYVHITTLERDTEFFDSVFKNATNGDTTGEATFISKRYLPRGNSDKEGVRTTSVESTYYWRPVQGSPYILCLVQGTGDYEAVLAKQITVVNDDDFLYHRLDLIPPRKSCSHFNRYATIDQPVVKFSPNAFINPTGYLQLIETENVVRQYGNYMKDSSSLNTYFKEGIRDMVLATSKVNELWTQNNLGFENYTLYRFIGSHNGVYRQFPGMIMNKKFDATSRPWYMRSKSNRGILTLSASRGTDNDEGNFITLSKAITESITFLSGTSDDVMVVMGMDITYSYFDKLMKKNYPQCEESKYRCFVMDSSGHLVMHPEFIQPGSRLYTRGEHITQIEPAIAQDLIDKNIMKKRRCVNFQNIKDQYYYVTEHGSQSRTIDNLDSTDSCTRYQFSEIPETNAYLGIIDQSRACFPQQCACVHDHCQRNDNDDCECPCLSSARYDFCNDQFSFSSDDAPSCTPPSPSLSRVVEEELDTEDLYQCFKVTCEFVNIPSECNSYSGCLWSVENEQCLENRVGSDEDEHLPIYLAACATAVVVIVGAVIGLVVYRRKLHDRNYEQPSPIGHSYPKVGNNVPRENPGYAPSPSDSPSAPSAPVQDDDQYSALDIDGGDYIAPNLEEHSL
ncbi:VWFA and cache domain-containing protein 1-like [Saccoglossus kowalevskii]